MKNILNDYYYYYVSIRLELFNFLFKNIGNKYNYDKENQQYIRNLETINLFFKNEMNDFTKLKNKLTKFSTTNLNINNN